MFQIATMWNLSRLDAEMIDSIKNITLRGYNNETFLTGEFANKLAQLKIRPLSVSNIADVYCPTRRDLYFYKGVNRLTNESQPETWGGKAGYMVEAYIENTFKSGIDYKIDKYTTLIKKEIEINNEFIKKKKDSIERLRSQEDFASGVKEGDTDWLLASLSNNGRAELSLKILHSLLKEDNSLDPNNIKTKQKLIPNKINIGINPPATPDFVISEFGIVGDIKTGDNFKNIFQLTCAGYALAYENEKERNNDINWGIIYFFPTRNPSVYVKPITFAQIYIFPVDDYLRQWFIDIRDEAYNIISKDKPPNFPDISKREQCRYCRFKEHCISEGLELKDYE